MRFEDIGIDYLTTRLGGSGLRSVKTIGRPAEALLVRVDAALPKTRPSNRGDERVSSLDVKISERDGLLEFRIEDPAPSEVMHPNWDGSGLWRDPAAASFRLLDESSFAGILERMIGSLNFRDGCWAPDAPVNRNAAAWCHANLKRRPGIIIKGVNGTNKGSAASGGAAKKGPVMQIKARQQAPEGSLKPSPATDGKTSLFGRACGGPNRDRGSGVHIIKVNYAELDSTSAAGLVSFGNEQKLKSAAETFSRGVKARRSEIVIPRDVDFNDLLSYLHINCPELIELPTLSYATRQGDSTTTVYVDYSLGEKETGEIRSAVERGVRSTAAEASKRPRGIEQLRYIYNYIASHAVYTPNKPFPWYSYSAAGVFLHNSAVCSGFSKCFMLIAKELGYSVSYVIGYLGADRTESHAWNLVELNGFTYHVDVTSAAVLFKQEHVCALPCFMMTTTEIRRSRIIKTPFLECDDPHGSYLARSGCAFGTADELMRLLTAFRQSEQPVLSVQARPALIGTEKTESIVSSALAGSGLAAICRIFSCGTAVFIKEGARTNEGAAYGFNRPAGVSVRIRRIRLT